MTRACTATLVAAAVTGLAAAATLAAPSAVTEFSTVAKQTPKKATGVVSQTPVTGGAKVLDGMVESGTRVGNTILIGGTFTKIATSKGTVVKQAYLAALDATTGDLITTFKPVLDGEVVQLQPGTTKGTFFAGGKFKKVNGEEHPFVAKLAVSTGAPQKWAVTPSGGSVQAIAVSGDRVFLGGDFTAVNGAKHEHLAEVSESTGTANSKFTMSVGGQMSSGLEMFTGRIQTYPSPAVRNLHVLPGGKQLVIVHAGTQVNREPRRALAMADISGSAPKLMPWNTSYWKPTAEVLKKNAALPKDARGPAGTPMLALLTDSDVTPDGKMLVIVAHGANQVPYANVAIAFPTSGGTDVKALWVTQNIHATLAVAASAKAIYIGGHFCHTEGPKSKPEPMFVPGKAYDGPCTTLPKEIVDPANKDMFVKRDKIAALDPATGRALEWNPGANGRHGITLLAMAGNDLLIGHDGDTIGGQKVGGFGLMRG